MTAQVVVAKVVVEGFHHWPQAIPAAAFLSHRHRHLFVIRAHKRVTHENRDTEFILMGRSIRQFLRDTYGSPAEFGALSCEAIAWLVAREFDLSRCEVWEDDENGAIVDR